MKRNVILISIDSMTAKFFTNQKLKMANLKMLMANGTYAESVKVVYPSSTWSSHSSIITGTYPKSHGVLGNWVIDKVTKSVVEHFGDLTDKEEVMQVPTLYDVAHDNRYSTASICWPLTRGAKKIDYNIPEFFSQALFENHTTKEFWNALKEAGLPVERYGQWSLDHGLGPMQDWLTAEIAKYLIKTHRPNFMMLHFLLPDSFQHDYGIDAPEALWSLEYVDERIGDIIKALKEEGMFDNTNIFITADHGQAQIHSAIRPNALFQQKGWQKHAETQLGTRGEAHKISGETKVTCVSNGGDGFIYIFEEDNKETLIREVKEALLATGVIEKIIDKEEYEELGLPVNHKDSPDFIIETKLGYYVDFIHGEEVIGESKFKGMHGYLPDYEEMKVSFIAHGPDVKQVKISKEINSVDIAPTIAAIMGLELNNVDGKVLQSIIKGD